MRTFAELYEVICDRYIEKCGGWPENFDPTNPNEYRCHPCEDLDDDDRWLAECEDALTSGVITEVEYEFLKES